MNQALMFSSKTDLWSTPQDLYDYLDEIYHFTLDPCSNDDNHKTEKYYTIIENGLIQDWSNDIVFMNPPYGREIGQWVKKAYDEYKKGATIVCLLPARTDTKWFHNYIHHIAYVDFLKGRLKFGGHKNSAPFPSMIVIYKGQNNAIS